jgi:hypothetical protein
MGFEIEAQHEIEFRQVKARELQLENVTKLDNITETLNDVDLASVEQNTNEIKDLIVNNIDSQVDLDIIYQSINKISQGVTDIKRNQTNLTKKINDIQKQINEGE